MDSRKELKERMRKTQFTFGSIIELEKGMKDAKSLYKSGIDAQGKKWVPANNRDDHSSLKKTNFRLGNKNGSTSTTEAHDQFKSMTAGHTAAQSKVKALEMIEKLKTNNISFREQKQGGQVNNYY